MAPSRGDHPSFESFCGDKEPQTLALLREYVFKGFGEVYISQADGEENFGPTLTAPHGNVRKVRFKNRVIPDLNANKVNDMASTWERIVLPRGWIMRETWLFLNNTPIKESSSSRRAPHVGVRLRRRFHVDRSPSLRKKAIRCAGVLSCGQLHCLTVRTGHV